MHAFTEPQQAALAALEARNRAHLANLEALDEPFREAADEQQATRDRTRQYLREIDAAWSGCPLEPWDRYFWKDLRPAQQVFRSGHFGEPHSGFARLTDGQEIEVRNRCPDPIATNKTVEQLRRNLKGVVEEAVGDNAIIRHVAGLQSAHEALDALDADWILSYTPFAQKFIVMQAVKYMADPGDRIRPAFHQDLLSRLECVWANLDLLREKNRRGRVLLKKINASLPFAAPVASEKVPQVVIFHGGVDQRTQIGNSNAFTGTTAIGDSASSTRGDEQP